MLNELFVGDKHSKVIIVFMKDKNVSKETNETNKKKKKSRLGQLPFEVILSCNTISKFSSQYNQQYYFKKGK